MTLEITVIDYMDQQGYFMVELGLRACRLTQGLSLLPARWWTQGKSV